MKYSNAKSQLVLLPAINFKSEVESNYISVTFVNFSHAQVQLANHVPVGFLQLYTEYQNEQNAFV